jgi:Fe-S cluster biosynthesis and repair protein YggX
MIIHLIYIFLILGIIFYFRYNNYNKIIYYNDLKYDINDISKSVFKAYYKNELVIIKNYNCNNNNFKSKLLLNKNIIYNIYHPNIIHIYGYIENSFNPLLVIEYMNLGSLYDIIHNSTVQLNNGNILLIIEQIIDGMIYLHNFKNPIIHNNLKTTNILLNSNFNVKITDFNYLNYRNTINKNLYYVAPEIIMNNNITIKGDIYSFGIILYELITKKDPYFNINDSVYNIILKIIDTKNPLRPEFIYDIYPEIKKIITLCWDINYKLRPTFQMIKIIINEIRDEFINFINNLINYIKNQQFELVDNYPSNIKKALLYNKDIIHINYKNIGLLFIDICNYTDLCSKIDNNIIIKMLSNFYSKLDELTIELDLVKIGNIGDSYIISTNLEQDNPNNILNIAFFALKSIEIVNSIYIDEENKGTEGGKRNYSLKKGNINKNKKYTLSLHSSKNKIIVL